MANASVGERLRSIGLAVWQFVSRAPLTYTWLTVLLVTTIIQRNLTKRQYHAIVVDGSTNIHHLLKDPLEVLIYSLFWIDGKYWTPYLVLLVGQFALIGAGTAGFILQGRQRELGLFTRPYYFLLTNLASLIATVRYLLGERVVTWKPIR